MVKILIDTLKNNKLGPAIFVVFIILSITLLLKLFSVPNSFLLLFLLVCFYIFISILIFRDNFSNNL